MMKRVRKKLIRNNITKKFISKQLKSPCKFILFETAIYSILGFLTNEMKKGRNSRLQSMYF